MRKTRIGVVIHTDLRDKIISLDDQARLNDLGDVVWTQSTSPITVDEACDLLADCEIAVGSWNTPHPNQAIVDRCPNLRLWEHVAGSVKHMFGPHLEGRDLTIASCNAILADVVAEMTVAEIILGLRDAFKNILDNRDAVIHGNSFHSRTLYGSTIGLIGASQIGIRVAKLLKAFMSSKVLLFDPYCSPEKAADLGVTLIPNLLDLCAASDVVSLHTPALESTRHLMGDREFAAMRDDCVFINTARGMCVDEAALISHLERGRLFAILDVTLPEPPTIDSPFRKLPNCVYTSHIAGPQAIYLGKQAVDDVEAFVNGRSPAYVVTESMLATMA